MTAPGQGGGPACLPGSTEALNESAPIDTMSGMTVVYVFQAIGAVATSLSVAVALWVILWRDPRRERQRLVERDEERADARRRNCGPGAKRPAASSPRPSASRPTSPAGYTSGTAVSRTGAER